MEKEFNVNREPVKFNLSEKRKKLRKDIKKTENNRDISFLFSLLDIVEKQDKEAVRLLKDENFISELENPNKDYLEGVKHCMRFMKERIKKYLEKN